MDGRLRCMRTMETKTKYIIEKKREASHILKYVGGGVGGCCCCGAVTLDPHERVLIFIKI